MGAWVDFSNHIEIADRSFENGVIKMIGYKEISDELIGQVIEDQRIKRIQISRPLPGEAFNLADRILEKRPDICFRIYGLYNGETLDLSILKRMRNLTGLWLDFHVRDRQEAFDFNMLSQLSKLRTLRLNLFDLRDYRFLENLSKDLESLSVYADTSSGGIRFDCSWLLQYDKLHTLYLGKKAKKNIDRIGHLPKLKKLTLQGIKPDDFQFMKKLNLESLSIRWCGSSNLHQIGEFTSLKELELWRIMKLEDISFISRLLNLEALTLIDLKHIRELPDLSKLTKLQDIRLDHVPVNLDSVDNELCKIIHC